ncbi:hypothetical protein L0222_16630 [bacterium]|nr:hypothetical protein [bacterium]
MNRRIEIGSCLSRSWALYKREFGLIFVTTLVINIASSAASGFPYVGVLIGLALNGVLFGGLYWFYLKLIRGEKAELADAFAGFQIALVPLMLASAVSGILILVVMGIVALPMLITWIPLLIRFSKDPNVDPDILLAALGAGTILNILFCILVATVLYLFWVFAFPLIIDKRMQFWDALEASRKAVMSNFASVFGLFLVGGLLTVGGLLACCIGVFFVLPVFFGSIAYAYEDLFGGNRPK